MVEETSAADTVVKEAAEDFEKAEAVADHLYIVVQFGS